MMRTRGSGDLLPCAATRAVPGGGEATLAHRRRVVAGASVAGAGLLGASLASEPDSPRFYLLTLGVAGTWLAGGLWSGPLHLGRVDAEERGQRRPVIAPVATGVVAFGAFLAAARAIRRFRFLDEALAAALRYATRGSDPLVLATALANGVAEEVFFRGAVYNAVSRQRAVPVSTAVYVAATSATRNPALVLASAVMGTLFAVQRRTYGSVQAPILTHLTWSALMLRYLPRVLRTSQADRRAR